jgi:CDP-diacylglycerol pyrophosphatase
MGSRTGTCIKTKNPNGGHKMGDITVAMKNSYQNNFELLEQQMGSELQDKIRRENIELPSIYFEHQRDGS